MNPPLFEIKGKLAVSVVDDCSQDLVLIRTDTSPTVEVAIVCDSADRAVGEAKAYADLLASSPPMLALLNEALGVWAEQFDGPEDQDLSISGADLVDWFADWRLRVRAGLTPTSVSPV